MSKVIVLLCICYHIFFLMPFANAQDSYTMRIKDEFDADIGSYFDIHIDSIAINSDTTLNFQMIPNLGIQDSILQKKYTSFLEMLKRNTGKELQDKNNRKATIREASSQNRNWRDPIKVFIADEFNNMDEIVRKVVNDINQGLGYQLLIEIFQQTNDGWNFDFSRADWMLDRDVSTEIAFSEDGIPTSCTFYIQGFFKYPNDLKARLREQIAEAFLQYKDHEYTFYNTGNFDDKYFEITEFSPDFFNIIKILTSLSSEHDFNHDNNETNNSPVSKIFIDQSEYLVGQEIVLDGRDSFDPDGYIQSYCWTQVFATKTGFLYATSNKVELSDSCASKISFIPEWPGNYSFKLTTTDNEGDTNTEFANVAVYWDHNPLEIKGVNTFAYYNPSIIDTYISNLITDISYHDNAEWIEFAPYWWMENKYSNSVHPLGEFYPGAPGFTIPDSTLKRLIDIFHSNNLKVLLRPTLEFYNWVDWRGVLEPTDWNEWFDSYNNFIVHYAQIAEENNVELFTVGNELHNATEHTEKWRTIIQNVRNVYPGEITYSDAALSFQPGLSNVKFWDDLDYIGVDFYYRITGSGPHWDSGYPPMMDPPFNIYLQSLQNCLDNILLPVHQKYNKPILITESGCRNMDGDNIDIGFWEGTEIDNKEQSDYYEALLQTISDEEWIKGFFLFVVDLKLDYNFVQNDWPLSFTPRDKPGRDVFKYWYR